MKSKKEKKPKKKPAPPTLGVSVSETVNAKEKLN